MKNCSMDIQAIFGGASRNIKQKVQFLHQKNGDFDLIFYEAYANQTDARNAEKYFKTGHGREVLNEKLKNYFGGVA